MSVNAYLAIMAILEIEMAVVWNNKINVELVLNVQKMKNVRKMHVQD